MSDSPIMAHPAPQLTLIVAATQALGIGINGSLPWPMLKGEMAYFARITKRNPSSTQRNAVIMGRRTWDSIPPRFRPLSNRLNVVISSSMAQTGEPLVARSLVDAIELLQGKEVGRLFVIGGASVYAAALNLPQARRVLLTKIKKPEYECDTFFPLDLDSEAAKKTGWRRSSKQDIDAWIGEETREAEEKGVQYEFSQYVKEEE